MTIERINGTVAMWRPDKVPSYGFLVSDSLPEQRIFAESAQIRQTPGLNVTCLFPGVRVIFTPVETPRGIQALDIELVPGRVRLNVTNNGATAVRTVY